VREPPWQPMRSMRRRRILDQRELWTHRAGGSFMANGAAEALPWLRGTARLLRRATSRRCREGIRVARSICVTSGHRGRTARSCALTCCIRDSRALGSRRLAAASISMARSDDGRPTRSIGGGPDRSVSREHAADDQRGSRRSDPSRPSVELQRLLPTDLVGPARVDHTFLHPGVPYGDTAAGGAVRLRAAFPIPGSCGSLANTCAFNGRSPVSSGAHSYAMSADRATFEALSTSARASTTGSRRDVAGEAMLGPNAPASSRKRSTALGRSE